MKILEVKDLCKTYTVNKRQNNVLKNVSFTIESGEMVAIMGPSGSGKSTLLYTVSGMDQITAGEVIFNNKSISNLSNKEISKIRLKEMGFIFQQMYMLKNLTIMDNILLPSMNNKGGKTKKEKIAECEDIMRKLSIVDVSNNGIDEVSGGQLQRACISRSMINNPKMIFADEPTGALNRSASDDVMQELTRINEEGTTIMLVTHDVKVASRCNRIMYIVDGNIKGEYNLSNYTKDSKDRERTLNNWLLEMGW